MTYQGEPIAFNPGIPGFVKAIRHYTGPVLVMTSFSLCDEPWYGMFWVKRLVHNARRLAPEFYTGAKTQAADFQFDYKLGVGPPPYAFCDSQKARVYAWEDDNICPIDDRPMPWYGCLFFTKYVWERVGGGNPLVLTSERRATHAMSMGGEIHIPADEPEFRTKPIILHEIAHELNKFDQHGPAFVSTYMDLCVRFLGFDREDLEASATRYRVNFLRD